MATVNRLVPKRLTIIGCGYLGGKLAEIAADSDWDVTGVRRSKVANASRSDIHWQQADVGDAESLKDLDLSGAVVYCVSPGARTEAAYQQAYVDGLCNVIARAKSQPQPPFRIVLVSSTGVYGQSAGEIVTERSAAMPAEATGQIILAGESALEKSGLSGAIFRLSGIYGPERDYFPRLVREGRVPVYERDEYTNRIHAEDASYAILHTLSLQAEGEGIFLGTDPKPSLRSEFLNYLAGAMAVAAPPPPGPGTIGNKRCMPTRLLASGFVFRYPDYRAGYRFPPTLPDSR